MSGRVTYSLPANVLTRLDVSRLINEVTDVDAELTAAAVRAKVSKKAKTPSPVLSDQLADFLELNTLSLDDARLRGQLIEELRDLKKQLPVLHMTFAVSADIESLQRIVTWLRESVHPQAVINVGVQPALIAGVSLRTPNHVMDLSLRKAFSSNHELLINKLEELRAGA